MWCFTYLFKFIFIITSYIHIIQILISLIHTLWQNEHTNQPYKTTKNQRTQTQKITKIIRINIIWKRSDWIDETKIAKSSHELNQ